MEQFQTRLRLGAALMVVGFVAELIMLSGLVIDARPPAWLWGFILLIGVGAVIVVSAFLATARDRTRRTRRSLAGDE